MDTKFERSGKIKMNGIQIIKELNLFFDIIIENLEKVSWQWKYYMIVKAK